ncbi:MAG: hypothetical protein PHF25_04560 [Candidatus Margulisbacteria bacterium]|nr:hypothetical protein [Candidatus Margulisiibacteriota bacterium]
MKIFQKMYKLIDSFLQKESTKGCGCSCSEDKTKSEQKNKDSQKCCKD